MNVAKVGDIVIGTCICANPPYPDVGVISSGFPGLLETGSPAAHLGSSVTFSCGSSTIISGTPGEITAGGLLARSGDSATGCGVGTVVASGPNISA